MVVVAVVVIPRDPVHDASVPVCRVEGADGLFLKVLSLLLLAVVANLIMDVRRERRKLDAQMRPHCGHATV